MPEFKVGWTYEVDGYVVLEAKGEQEAYEIVYGKLDNDIDFLDNMDNDIVRRDFSVTEVNEI